MTTDEDRSYDAVLFDFGGVLTTSPFATLEAKGSAVGLAREELLRLILGPDEDGDHPWHRVERGELALREALALIAADAAERGVGFDAGRLATFFGPSNIQHEVVEYIRALRAEGYRTALVTNNARELAEYWMPMLPLEELFDVVVDSCVVGVRKPNPRVWEMTLARLGDIPPHRAVFIDDLEINVAAARRVGLAGVVMGADAVHALREVDAVLGRAARRTSSSGGG